MRAMLEDHPRPEDDASSSTRSKSDQILADFAEGVVEGGRRCNPLTGVTTVADPCRYRWMASALAPSNVTDYTGDRVPKAGSPTAPWRGRESRVDGAL